MGKFVIYQQKTGFNFHLKAGNGETIGTSQVYAGKESCIDGIESVMKNASIAGCEDLTVSGSADVKCPKFQVYTDPHGAFHFRLLATNGQNILASQAYTTKASCQNGIKSVIENAPVASVEEASSN